MSDAPPALPENRLRVLERAAKITGAPLTVHAVHGNREEELLAGWGGCAACLHVAGTEPGRRACRQSRLMAVAMARRQNVPVTFVCHLGFGCVSAAWPGRGEWVITMGPYVPSGTENGLAVEVARGLAKLTGKRAAARLPFSLDDIRSAPYGSLTATAEWLLEELARIDEAEKPEEAASEAPAAPLPSGPGRAVVPVQLESPGGGLALALAGGQWKTVRTMLRGLLEETPPRRGMEARRVSAFIAVLTKTLAAAQKAGGDLTGAWSLFSLYSADAVGPDCDDKFLLDGAMRVLKGVRWPAAPTSAKPPLRMRARLPHQPLNEILMARCGESVTLEEIAAELGESPSAVTHRLQRKFGLSFSEYLACIRVEKAKPLLRKGRLSIVEVGRRVGINDGSNFSRTFSRVTGMRPAEYKAACRAGKGRKK
ncbi:MAG: helix-turn-helix domain-containing protein [Candidatus Hydrogenedentes bacterium]|nr:helix-turn-helix domain-containing protein [Candidatus Hydrogenedentota bacterium]